MGQVVKAAVRHAEGADVFVHEVAMARPEMIAAHSHVRTVPEHHITAREVGKGFARVRPKLAVLTHLIFKGPTSALGDLLDEVAEAYDGNVLLAQDLMVIRLGKTISVYSAKAERG